MKRTLTIAVATLSLAVASAAGGNPNPTESQDAYWDLRDQAAGWREHRIQKSTEAARKTPPKPAPEAPVAERPARS
jgi:hypothetical protein